MRLVTRPDLDGLTCAVLLSECERIDSVELVHPQDVTDRRLAIGPTDVLANLPYHPSCGMWFDNHLLTDPKAMPPTGFRGRYGKAPSAARLVYEHYLPGRPGLCRHETLVTETDRLDSAQLTLEDVVAPSGYILLGLTLDPRTGLGGPREYFDRLLVAVRERPVEEVVTLPEANVGVRVQWGPGREKVAVSGGRSIFNRTSRANLGVLMSLYGGGGHAGAGACLLPSATADAQIGEIVSALKPSG